MVQKPINSQISNKAITIAFVLMVALSTIPMPVIAAENLVTGTPELAVSSPDSTFEASSSPTLTLTLANNGDVRNGGETVYEQEVKTARSIQVRVLEDRIDAPIEVQTGTQTIGQLPEGSTAPLQYKLEIGNAKPGTYRIPVKLV